MTNERKVYNGASESCHWYDENGIAKHEVESADGKKMVKTTLTQAKKLGLYPSVTSIFKILDKHGVNEWKLDLLLKVIQETNNTGKGLSTYAFKKMLLEQSEEERTQGANEGTEIHKAVEKYLVGNIQSDSAKYQLISQRVQDIIASYSEGICTTFCEQSFTNQIFGYAGCVDIISEGSEYTVVADLKTTTTKNYDSYLKKPYDEWIMQLAAYKRFPYFVDKNVKILSIVANRDNGDVGVYEWSGEDDTRGWNMFSNLLKYYQLKNNFKGGK